MFPRDPFAWERRYWTAGARLRRRALREELRSVCARLSEPRLAALSRDLGLLATIKLLSRAGLPDPVAGHPSLRAWLFNANHFADSAPLFATPRDWEGWRLLLLQVHGFALSASLIEGRRLELVTLLDDRGHLHLPGLGLCLDAGARRRLTPIRLRVGSEGLLAARQGERPVLFPRKALLGRSAMARGDWRINPHPRISGELEAMDCDPTITVPLRIPRGPYEHALAILDPDAMNRYARGLRAAVGEIASVDPRLARDVTDEIRLVVPLKRADRKVHVSSTYEHLRGIIFLCHDPNPLVQAETLVHEFSHNKLHDAIEIAPPFSQGPAPAHYYSPWRKDPRPLKGILLGAHAFTNVALFYARSAHRRRGQRGAVLEDCRTEAARRLLQIERALSVVQAHASLTAAGRRLAASLARSAGEIRELLPPPPGSFWGAAEEPVEEHYRRYGTPEGLHKTGSPA